MVLEDKDGGARSCGASRLTFLLREQPALRLVVLNACEGGRSSRTDPFAGVAQSLVQGAIPAVVAMQFPVTDAAAVVFASAFYEALAAGRPVDLALAEARREVNLRGDEGEIEWATPVLYMRGDGELFSFEEREPVQPEPTDVTPTAATPTPGTGAAPTAKHDREPKAEPAKTQPEEAGKKASQEPPRSPWKIAVPIIVLSAVVLGFNLIYTFQQPTPAGDPLVAKGRELKQALEAFQLSSGRQEELKLPLPLKSAEAIQGQEIFNSAGKCFRCHANAGANVPGGGGNSNFNTGVEDLPDPTGDFSQPDDGLGIRPAGDGTFNTPSLVEAADTGPFFHNNSVDTIEGAVAFYNSDAFNNSPAGQFLSGGTGRAIALDPTQVKAVAAFLRVINALDNIRELNKLLAAVQANVPLAGEHPEGVVKRAVHDIDDAIMVLKDGGLHPDAVQRLQEARGLTEKAATNPSSRIKLAKEALDAINQAKSLILG